MVYAQARTCPSEWDTKNSQGFCKTNILPEDQTYQKKKKKKKKEKRKKTGRLIDFAVRADRRV